MIKQIKIFSRLAKEANLFLSKEYKQIIDFFNKNKTYVFYGLADISFSRLGEKTETKYFKLQMDFARALIEENLLDIKDYDIILFDTIQRYSVPRAQISFRQKWADISLNSGKKEFVDFFFEKYEEKIHKLNGRKKRDIINGLPRA